MPKIPAGVLLNAAREINADDLTGHEGFMCLTPSIELYSWSNGGVFKDVLERHGISRDGALREGMFPDEYGTWDRNETRVWWLLLVAESGVQ